MDYIGYKCPVCNKYFHADDDVVVCPECGTPHHRECYEQTGHCIYEDRHASGFDYQKDDEDAKDQPKRCPSCGKENDANSFFCNQCGAPLSADHNNDQQSSYNEDGFPRGTGQAGNPFYATFNDPMGGVPSDTDFGDGITAGETAKYVKQNTPYFIRVFSNIKNFNKSKFNFAAALFRGGYMLYRKMYLPGAIITTIQLLMTFASTYLQVFGYKYFSDEFAKLYDQAWSYYSFGGLMSALGHANSTEFFIVVTPFIISLVNIVMMIVIGICFNKMYMNHCKKQITLIKAEAEKNGENPETILQTKGGVNIGLAVSLLITSILLNYLPNIILGLT